MLALANCMPWFLTSWPSSAAFHDISAAELQSLAGQLLMAQAPRPATMSAPAAQAGESKPGHGGNSNSSGPGPGAPQAQQLVRGAMLSYHGHPVWGTLPKEDMQALHALTQRALLPAAGIMRKVSGQGRLVGCGMVWWVGQQGLPRGVG